MATKNFLRGLIISGIFLVPFIPLIISTPLFFPFITGKNFAFRIIVEIIFAAWLLLLYYDASYRPKKNLITIAVGTFIGVVAIADIFGINPYRSFWSNYERMEGLVSLLHVVAYFFVATTIIVTEKLWSKFFHTLFGVSFFLTLYSAMQIHGELTINQGSVRADATLGNATYFAVFLLINIFLMVFWFVRNKGKGSFDIFYSWVVGLTLFAIFGFNIALSDTATLGFYGKLFLGLSVIGLPTIGYLYFVKNENVLIRRGLYCFIFILDLIALYYTATRGAILGLIAGAALSAVLIAWFNRENRLIRNSAIGIITAVVLFVGLFWALKDSQFVANSPVLSRFSTISFTEQTVKSRAMIWNMSWQGVKENPLLGWGQDNFIAVFAKHYNPKMWSQEPWFDRSHNVFFDWLIAAGFLGLLAYLSMFAMALYSLWKLTSSLTAIEKSILTGLFGAYFFHNLFVFDNLVSYILFFSLIGFINVMIFGGDEPNPQNKQITPNKKDEESLLSYVFVPSVFIGFVLVMYFANIKPISASMSLIQAISPQEEKDGGLNKNFEYFEKTFAYNTFGSGEAREQLIQVSLKINQANVPIEIKQKFVNLARNEMIKQIEESPLDVRYPLFLGGLLNNYSQFGESITYLEKARTISPKKQQVLFELGTTYINRKEFDKAVEVLKEAYEGDKTYNDARVIYATSLIYAGRASEAEAILGDSDNLDNRLINAYAATGNYNKLLVLLDKKLKSNPNDPQTLLNLAAIYLQVGDRAKSVELLERIIQINPQFKEQGEYYIKEIKAGRNP
jgi:tetratricopeptide (TPR) repeat protein/O-antigen ligase